MVTHPTFEQLNPLGLFGMVKAFEETEASAEAAALTHPEWLALLLSRELASRHDKKTWRPTAPCQAPPGAGGGGPRATWG